jgi:hypothetical protein
MSKMKERQMLLELASKELELKGFKPEVVGLDLHLQVWNEDLTEAYHIAISDGELEYQAEAYQQRQIQE